MSAAAIPKEKTHWLRERIKRLFRRPTTDKSLEDRLGKLDPMLRGWGSFYRHAWRASRVFAKLDDYVWRTLLRWAKKKHGFTSRTTLFSRYGWHRSGGRSFKWRDGKAVLYELARIRTGQYRLAWMRPPDFASTPVESPVHNERCTPGSEGGARKPGQRKLATAPGAHLTRRCRALAARTAAAQRNVGLVWKHTA